MAGKVSHNKNMDFCVFTGKLALNALQHERNAFCTVYFLLMGNKSECYTKYFE